MNSLERLAKIEARKRGSGRRNVKTSDFSISSTSENRKRRSLLNSLESQLIKKEDTQLLVRSDRRKSSQIRTSLNEADLYTTSRYQSLQGEALKAYTDLNSKDNGNASHFSEDLTGNDYEYNEFDDNMEYEEFDSNVSRKTSKSSQAKTPLGNSKGLTSKRLKSASAISEKKTRNRSRRKSKSTKDLSEHYANPGNHEDKIYKIRKNARPPQTIFHHEKALGDSTDSSNNSSRKYPTEKAIDCLLLLKTKSSERQKPMTIDIERIIIDSKKDRRFKINTYDVLKHLVKNYQPLKLQSLAVNENTIQEEFKTHVLSHIEHLADMHFSIKDISEKISEIQRMKLEYRTNIYKIREDHNNVGTNLSRLRKEYSLEVDNYNKNNSLCDKFESVNRSVNHSNSNDMCNDIHSSVNEKLRLFSKLAHSLHGICQKLSFINDELINFEGNYNKI
ncbi:uncharacterized protein PRCAT00004650001 [Priceomyces carsonii]|uniref:uncharacterized protein n=1 Tax=Priceomyces carsonii TaxID=28549 RepID=UPI002ED94B2A|nr:unnamed protein product [Priceomyces carsonii]